MSRPRNERQLTRDLAAYLAEQRRWPALQKLPEGTVLRRTMRPRRGPWVKTVREVTVVAGGYESEGVFFATLHDVMVAWVGVQELPRNTALGRRRVCKFSTRRFFYDAVMNALWL